MKGKKFGTQPGVHLIESVCLIQVCILYFFFLAIQWFFPGRPEGQTPCKILSYTISLSYLTKNILSAYATNMPLKELQTLNEQTQVKLKEHTI